MRMNKKIIISIVALIIAFVLFGLIWKFITDKNTTTDNSLYVTENVVNISEDEGVLDECTEEWEEYNNELQSAFEEASSTIGEDTTRYILKSEKGYIVVYYLDKNNEEFLYRKTTISVDYLSPEDIDNLEKGIEVVGIDALNKILEDFE